MTSYTVAIATFGGHGGGPLCHQEALGTHGYQMGCGNNGCVLTSLQVEKWRVLSHTYATYTFRTGEAAYVVPGVGNSKSSDSGLRSNCLSHISAPCRTAAVHLEVF